MQLNLEEREVQEILNALAQRPYIQVVNLIQKIITQTNAPPDTADASPPDS